MLFAAWIKNPCPNVVCCLDSIIPLFAIAEISRPCLCLTWSQIPKTGFLVMWPTLMSHMIRKGTLVLCGLWSFKHTCTATKWAAARQNQPNRFALSEDSDQPGHSPSLIRVFTVHFIGSYEPNDSSCGRRRLWSDWADAQADLSLCWVHIYFVGFVVLRLEYFCHIFLQFLLFVLANTKGSGKTAPEPPCWPMR